MSELRRRLVGLQLEGANEPSHHLLDLCAAQALEALRRRGIAMTFAGSVSYPGMARITVSQIVAADKQVFVRLIEAGIRPKRGDDKSFPMDAALMAALESYEVSQKDDDPKKPRKGNGKGDAENFCMSCPPAINPKLFATLCDECDFDLFTSDVPARSSIRDPSIHTFTTGAYVRGGATFTSIALLRNQSAHLHRGIWVAGLGDAVCPQPLDDVPVGLGGVLSFAQGPLSFDSHQWHCTAPWTGDRSMGAILIQF
ncbi:unnamed protein product [Symbiodinium necroappetens]|uniref:Uncharacterized protein n=1 Tax=Symbiodinium necroappetens TaxID=1628268 RepID=A0A813BFP9_9DINO|nr:unnamed protein product [Symbiodinium necroappetens]